MTDLDGWKAQGEYRRRRRFGAVDDDDGDRHRRPTAAIADRRWWVWVDIAPVTASGRDPGGRRVRLRPHNFLRGFKILDRQTSRRSRGALHVWLT